jgi:superfamily II DNA or RNA helicase
MAFELRDFQIEAIDAAFAAWGRGMIRPAIVLPTGSGKTIMFVALIGRWLAENPGMRVLVVAHRTELIDQAYNDLRNGDRNLSVGIVKAGRNETLATVVVASVQTLASGRRKDQIRDVGLVVIDECHHGTANSYVGVLEHYGTMGDVSVGCVALGVTATMVRGDNASLGDVWQDVVYERSILWMISRGYLVPPLGIRLRIAGMNLSKVKVSRGDYAAGDLGRELDASLAPGRVADAIVEYAGGRRGILFAPTVEVAEHFVDELRGVGLRAGMITGKTPDGERSAALGGLGDGSLDIVVNCMVLTEGTNIPCVDLIVITRATKSKSLYLQMAGRGLRSHPGKTDCLIMVVGDCSEHSLITPVELWGEDPDVDQIGDELDMVDVLPGGARPVKIQYVYAPTEAVTFDLFQGASRAEYLWFVTDAGIPVVEATSHYILVLACPVEGRYDVCAVPKDEGEHGQWVIRGVSSAALARAIAEEKAREIGSLYRRGAFWHGKEPSSRVLAFAARLGIDTPPWATSGAVSQMISQRLATRRLDTRLPSYARAAVKDDTPAVYHPPTFARVY